MRDVAKISSFLRACFHCLVKKLLFLFTCFGIWCILCRWVFMMSWGAIRKSHDSQSLLSSTSWNEAKLAISFMEIMLPPGLKLVKMTSCSIIKVHIISKKKMLHPYSPIPNKRVYMFINSETSFPLYMVLLGYTRLLNFKKFQIFC